MAINKTNVSMGAGDKYNNKTAGGRAKLKL